LTDLTVDADTLGPIIGHLVLHLAIVPTDGSVAKSLDSTVEGFIDDLWDAFHWCTDTMRNIENWLCYATGEVYGFIINIAGEAKTFLVNSLQRVMKAIEYVLNELKVDTYDMIEWLGQLIDPFTTSQAQTDLNNMTKGVFDQVVTWSGNITPQIESSLDSGFGMLRSALDKLDPTIAATSAFSIAVQDGAQAQSSEINSVLPTQTQDAVTQLNNNPLLSWARDLLASGEVLEWCIRVHLSLGPLAHSNCHLTTFFQDYSPNRANQT